MKKNILMLCILMPLLVNAQMGDCIQFSSAKNWKEVINLARAINKPIFVDVYATWCGPCKIMDREVYTDKNVADYVNANFIAVKVQMDSTEQDNEFIKGWHADAANWKLYVDAYPSFLFYTAEGIYLGKEIGFYSPIDFITVLKKMIDPQGSYLAQLKAFEAGRLNRPQVVKLAYWAKDNKDDSSALKIAKFYKSQYLDRQIIDSLLNSEFNEFCTSFIDLFSFKDAIIQYIYSNPEKSDLQFSRSIGYSRTLTDYVIARDYIYPMVNKNTSSNTTPDWKKIEREIENFFDGRTAKRLILDSKITWAYRRKNWDDAVKLEFKKIETYGMDTSGMGRVHINNLIYEVAFRYVMDRVLLKKAANYMKIVFDLDSSSHGRLDTYACILYKAGQRSLAIMLESKALSMAESKESLGAIAEYKQKIDQMEKNEPIWR